MNKPRPPSQLRRVARRAQPLRLACSIPASAWRSSLLPRGVCLLLIALLSTVTAVAQAKGKGSAQDKNKPSSEPVTVGSTGNDLDALRRSYRSHPSPDLLLQIGLALGQAGQALAAHDHIRRALADGPSPSLAQQIQQGEALLRAPLSMTELGELRIKGQVGGLVAVDNVVVAALPLSLPLLLPAGPHHVEIQQGSKRWQADVTLPKARMVDLRFAQDTSAAVITTPPAVLLLPATEREGEISFALLKTVDRALRRANLARAAIEGSPEKPLGGSGCVDSLTCQLKQGEQHSVDFVLSLREKTAGSRCNVTFQLVDMAVADVAIRKDLTGERCDSPALATQIQQELESSLPNAATRPRGELLLTSDPATAQVFRGDVLLGSTPLRRPAFPGALELTLRLPEHQPQKLQISVVENQTARQKVQLVAIPRPVKAGGLGDGKPAPRPTVPRWRLALGGVALGGGLLMMGVGVPALAVNGRCVREAVPPARICDGVFDTLPLGLGLTLSGGALSAVGLTLLLLPPKRPR